MFGVNGGEFIVLIIVALVILGPERLPEYAAKLGQWVRQARSMAEGARGQLREQMGPEFDDIDWKQYDPRQYDPRRIVREALLDDPSPSSGSGTAGTASADAMAAATPAPTDYDPARPTPWDADAT